MKSISTIELNSKPIDYLSVGRKIELNNELFELKWSTNPSIEYYKQEYLRESDQLPQYEKMILVEALKGDLTVYQVANGKINELEEWKQQNPVIDYRIYEIEEKNEVILDFLLSDGNATYEWNIYRYRNESNTSGNFLVLYAYSYRNYITNKEDLMRFVDVINKESDHLVAQVSEIELPEVVLRK